MRFEPSFIERVRNHFLISEIIGKRLQLKKRGREYLALCPFHKEKSPSFTVNDEKGFYHCFGCQANGDAISFLIEHDHLTYPEAIEQLARDAGIPLPEPTYHDPAVAAQEKSLYDVLEAACAWFEQQLASPRGAIAREYVQKRGLQPATLRQFRIGYAPDERSALLKHLSELGFSKAMQAEAGLIIVPDDGEAYDRFRGRVTFAIRNPRGKVIAFGGRLLVSNEHNKHLPKYLNSPETPLFKKGEMLFNLDLAKRPARATGNIVVMEGYMDVVSTWQAGVDYAVATLGTAVTSEHLRLLWQLAKAPVICLDGDAAGARAMLRAGEIALPLLQPEYSLRFAALPKGEDPDSYIQAHGKQSFEKILAGSRHVSEIWWEHLVRQHRLDVPEGRAALEHRLLKLSATIVNPIVRKQFETEFRGKLWEKTKQNNRQKPKERSHHIEHLVIQHHSAALDQLIRQMLSTVLHFPLLLQKSAVEEVLHRLDITNPKLDMLRNTLLAATHAHLDNTASLQAYLEEQLPDGAVAGLMERKISLPYTSTTTLDDAFFLWNESLGSYKLALIEFEIKNQQEKCTHSMAEEDFKRLAELKSEQEKATQNRTFAPTATDAA